MPLAWHGAPAGSPAAAVAPNSVPGPVVASATHAFDWPEIHLDPHLTGVLIDDLAHDRQPQPRPALRA